MARRFHPDVSKIHNAKARFQQVAEAYEVLERHRDSYCRAYEQSLKTSVKRRNKAQDAGKRNAKSSAKQQSDYSREKCRQRGKKHSSSSKRQEENNRYGFDSYGQMPVDGKNREVVYPMTLRYAIRLLRMGSFYIPGLKVQMKFTRQAFEGKTFRLKGKGYKGIFGGKSGDYLVRFNIKVDEKRYQLEGGDIYANFEVPRLFLKPGKKLFLDSPSGRVEWRVPQDPNLSDYIHFRKMGLPADREKAAGDLYAKIIPI